MSEFFSLLISFLLVHIICDFYLQPARWVEAKKQRTYRSVELYCHALLHGVVLILPALVLDIHWHLTAYLVVWVTVTHFAIDLWKVTSANGDKLSHFIIDQTLHVTVLAVSAFYLVDGITINAVLKHEKLSACVQVIFAYLLILKPTSIVISQVLQKYTLSGFNPDESTPQDQPLSKQSKPEITGLVAGGELIGYLERVLILTFTLVGSYAAVGFVLAAKSIFRFGELNKANGRSMTEYVLIGSLLSVVITTLVGAIVSLSLGVKIN
ncbi:DUF3307 domain-containing protein [Alteromonas sp. M12]|uniref:DUF3307 domain-containing protein n=1 Tax=Alteromonas sp. M12 TaxID=3135644 RepID=UPI00319EA726